MSKEYKGQDLTKEAWKGNLDQVKKIVSRGVDINYKPRNGDPLLVIGCEKNRPDMVLFALEKEADVNLPGRNNSLALNQAALKGNVENIKHLLNYNAEINRGSLNGSLTPVATAARALKKDAVVYLVFQGANIHIKDKAKDNKTILEEMTGNLLCRNNSAILKILDQTLIISVKIITLIQKPALTPHILDENLASMKKDFCATTEVSKKLIPNLLKLTLDEQGRNIGHYLAEKHHWKLIDHLSKQNLSLDTPDSKGRTVRVMINLAQGALKAVEKINDEKTFSHGIGKNVIDFLDDKDLSALCLTVSPEKKAERENRVKSDESLKPHSSPKQPQTKIIKGKPTQNQNFN